MDVAAWLEDLDLGQYASSFAENAIDASTLRLLTDEDLRELGVTALGHRKKLMAAITALENGGDKIPAPLSKPDGPAAAPAADGEMRQVTVMFADLSGFTELSRQMDAEATHGLLNRFFEAVDGVVRAYGGRVDKHIGDSVMAVFGAPQAHSNDPERAARASLEVHRAVDALAIDLEISLKAHIGIASGQVVASDTGSTTHREYTVTGESVNLAARLQDMAGPGETCISEAVFADISHFVTAEAVEQATVKGLAKPIRVWRLSDIKVESGPARDRPFIGRRSELRQFNTALQDCLEDGRGQTIYIRGEAGIGKTRLIEEFQRAATDAGLVCHRGLVLDFGVGKGQDAIRAIVRSLLEIPAGSGKAVRNFTAESAVEKGIIDEPHRVHLNDLLDLPQPTALRAMYDAMDNAARNQGKQQLVSTLTRHTSTQKPLVLFVEDVHWADKIVLGHLASLTASVSECPALLIMTSRIEGDPLDQAWRSQTRGAPLLTIDLGPLRDDEARVLASKYLEANSRFAQSCVERAGGNPLFLDQLLRTAEETSGDQVPGSVQSIVLSRMDSLSATDKAALQAASVIGQRFSLELLRHLMESPQYTAAALVEHFLVRPEGEEFLFAHALIRDGVYSSLLSARKKDLHTKAATWFEDHDPILRAEHLDRAEAPEAVTAYLEAAELQASLYHFERALELLDRGLAVADGHDAQYRLLMRRGEFLREMGQPADSIDIYRRAKEVASDDIESCRAMIGLVAGMRVTDEFDEALTLLEQAEETATVHGLEKELSQIHYYRGNLYFPLGNIDGCLEQHGFALKYAERIDDPEDQARALSGLGDAYYSRGHMVSSLDYFRRCIALCREHGIGRIEVGNMYMVAWTRLYQMEVMGALEDAIEAIAAAERVGHNRAEMVARLTAARVLVEMGDIDAAEPHITRGIDLAENLGANRFKPFLMIYLGRFLYAKHGHRQTTVDLMQEALEISRQTGIGFLGPWVLSTLALVHDDPVAGQEALDEGEQLLKSGCVGHNYFAYYRSAIEVMLRQENWDGVDRYADGLEAYASEERLPWADFISARGRALASVGRGKASRELYDTMDRLCDTAREARLLSAVPSLERAMANIGR